MRTCSHTVYDVIVVCYTQSSMVPKLMTFLDIQTFLNQSTTTIAVFQFKNVCVLRYPL